MYKPTSNTLKAAARRLNVSEEEYVAEAIYLETHSDGEHVFTPPRELLVPIKKFTKMTDEEKQTQFDLDDRAIHDVARRCARIVLLHLQYQELST